MTEEDTNQADVGSGGNQVIEPQAEPTAQPAEPLVPEPEPTPESTPEPVSAPQTPPDGSQEPITQEEGSKEYEVREELVTPEPILVSESTFTSQPPAPTTINTSLARQLLIKAREVIQFRKRKKLEKIMSLFLKKQSITNDDVQKLVYVSDATATRYLNQLEREGRIVKQGSPNHASYIRM